MHLVHCACMKYAPNRPRGRVEEGWLNEKDRTWTRLFCSRCWFDRCWAECCYSKRRSTKSWVWSDTECSVGGGEGERRWIFEYIFLCESFAFIWDHSLNCIVSELTHLTAWRSSTSHLEVASWSIAEWAPGKQHTGTVACNRMVAFPRVPVHQTLKTSKFALTSAHENRWQRENLLGLLFEYWSTHYSHTQ